MRFSYATPSKATLGPLHTEKALVKRSTPKFPKRNKTANKDNLDMSEGIVELDIDTAVLPDETIDPQVPKLNPIYVPGNDQHTNSNVFVN